MCVAEHPEIVESLKQPLQVRGGRGVGEGFGETTKREN